ncbi:MAG: hypothetical protein JWO88_950 [Frankiales bacterium]|nr:hypothetical protein [Frankiales bacterium]
MASVDYDDDGIRRFVVRRYAYDPARRERRHIVVAVLDNKRDFDRVFERYTQELQRRRDDGEPVDPREHISGHVLEPGHLARTANGHLVRRAIERGVYPDRLRDVELPGNIAVFTAGGEGDA